MGLLLMTQCSLVGGHQHFGRTYCLHLRIKREYEVAGSYETSLAIYESHLKFMNSPIQLVPAVLLPVDKAVGA
jgi:hypothetical protein